MTIEVRKLVAGDLFKAANILRKVFPHLPPELFQKQDTEEGRKDQAERIGKQVVQVGMEYALDDLWEFLASMAGETVDEFNQEPLEAPMQVIEALVEQEDLTDFFKRAQALIQ